MEELMMRVMLEYLGAKNKFPDAPKFIPMRLLSEEQAQSNHGQTLKRLNERGGLGIMELLDNLKRQKLTLSWKEPTQQDVDELNRIINEAQAVAPKIIS